MKFKNTDKTLLILDVDETLIFSTDKRLNQPSDFTIFDYHIYKRPFLDEFIQALKDDFLLAIWSSASDDYIEAIVKEIIPQEINLEFVWARSRCTYRRNIQIDDFGYYNDDTGYPNWNDIENTFEIAFKELQFNILKEKELEAIGFLIARQWDIGNIFPYFNKEISLLGMTENQLLILAEYGLISTEWSFKQQCAASIWKAKQNKNKAIEIAVKYFQDEDADIRKHSLHSLYKLEYKNINQL